MGMEHLMSNKQKKLLINCLLGIPLQSKDS